MASVAGPARWLFVVGLLSSACGSAISEHPAESVTRYLPATLEAAHARVGDARIAKVRIYADPGVRALPHWKEDILDQLDYASQLLQPLVGVKLAVDSVKEWSLAGDLHDSLRALVQADRADDVTWGIGYSAPSAIVSTAMSELGDAQPLGHQVV